MRASIVLGLLAAAATTLLVTSGCKSDSSNPTNPSNNEVTTFSFKAGGKFHFLWFQVDDSSRTIDSTEKNVYETIVATDLALFNRTGVAMAIDSIVPVSGSGATTIDTVYYWTDGSAFAQYGFISELVNVFSSGLIAVTPKWNTLVDTVKSWTTDTTTATFGSINVQETTTATDHGVSYDSLGTQRLRVRAAEHEGRAVMPLGTMQFPFSVKCSYSPSTLLFLYVSAVDVPGFGYHVPQTQRILLTYTQP